MFIYDLETIVGVFLIVVMGVWYLSIVIKEKLKQRRCTHERYSETSSCDAICHSCGKNLGFIGNLRKQRKSSNSYN